jgi:hypothetical protein
LGERLFTRIRHGAKNRFLMQIFQTGGVHMYFKSFILNNNLLKALLLMILIYVLPVALLPVNLLFGEDIMPIHPAVRP